MLDAEYLLHLTEAAEDIAAQLHNEIIKRIVERVVARIKAGKDYLLTASDKYQIELLQDAGFLRSDIEKEIAQLTKKELTEMKAAFEDAGIESFSYDSDIYRQVGIEPGILQQSPQLIRLLQRGYEATAGTWENLCRTTADAAQQTFIRECDKVYNLVSTGAVSHTDAYIKAIDTIATDGVVITYPSGHRDTIETATLRCMRTGVAQACAEVTNARMDEYNWDIVLVSAHLGARYTAAEDFTNHEWWQGKFYSRSGTDDRFPPFSVCGLGDVQGLCGANCRHSYGPGDGINNPFEGLIDSAENRRLYDLSQKQRALERRIRKSKRELVGMKAGVDGAPTPEAKEKLQAMYDQKALKLKRQNEAYRDFCEKNGLKTREERIATAKFDREQGKAARAAAKREENRVANVDGSGIIKARIENGEISSRLNVGQQKKHIEGTNEFLRYKESRLQKGHTPQSIATISMEEAQELIAKHCGTGAISITGKGTIRNVEYCNADFVVGKYFRNDRYYETVRFVIHYGKKGAHIIPTPPEGE